MLDESMLGTVRALGPSDTARLVGVWFGRYRCPLAAWAKGLGDTTRKSDVSVFHAVCLQAPRLPVGLTQNTTIVLRLPSDEILRIQVGRVRPAYVMEQVTPPIVNGTMYGVSYLPANGTVIEM